MKDAEYIKYMCELYEDIHGRWPSQEWIEDLMEFEFDD